MVCLWGPKKKEPLKDRHVMLYTPGSALNLHTRENTSLLSLQHYVNHHTTTPHHTTLHHTTLMWILLHASPLLTRHSILTHHTTMVSPLSSHVSTTVPFHSSNFPPKHYSATYGSSSCILPHCQNSIALSHHISTSNSNPNLCPCNPNL
jgi:hypothetical protein